VDVEPDKSKLDRYAGQQTKGKQVKEERRAGPDEERTTPGPARGPG
jgi:hypothetical protein